MSEKRRGGVAAEEETTRERGKEKAPPPKKPIRFRISEFRKKEPPSPPMVGSTASGLSLAMISSTSSGVMGPM